MLLPQAVEPPPQNLSSSFYEECSIGSFRPGDFSQDIYTIPIELGLIESLSYFYNPRSKTFLIGDEETNLRNSSTTYGRSTMLPYLVGVGGALFSGLYYLNDDFRFWTQIRGFTHALLLSEIANSSAKLIFQKKRPNYHAQMCGANDFEPDDARASFYSDHSNMAFAFSTYTSLLMYQYSHSFIATSVYSVGLYTAASLVSASRVDDHAHNLSDVMVGALMGTTISALTFFRVQEGEEEINSHSRASDISVEPGVWLDVENKKTWYTANFEMEIR